MTINPMHPVLITINQINNLQRVRFVDITSSIPNNSELVQGLMIKYNNGSRMIMNDHQPFYTEYVRKVNEVYQREKNSRYIDVDGKTKKILDNGKFEEKDEVAKFYRNKDSYPRSLIFESDEVKSIIDIIRYKIKEFGDFTNLVIKLSDKFQGYRENYVIEAEINDILTYLQMEYQRIDSTHYKVIINNLIENNKPYEINISFTESSIDIIGTFDDYELANSFYINKTNARSINTFRNGNKILRYQDGFLEQVNNPHPNISNLDNDSESTWYKLPWYAFYGYSEKEKELDESASMTTRHITYLDINNRDFFKIEKYSKKARRKNSRIESSLQVVQDEFTKIPFGFNRDSYFIIETTFLNAYGNGIYEEQYNNRFFYHIAAASTTNEITREDLVSADKDTILEDVDLLNERKLKRLRGKKDGHKE